MDAIRKRLSELARAVAEGRLALAEVAAISGEELDAIYETAVMRLDTGRPAEAARMLAALVVLYPFAHEYWRAYAVALTRLGELPAARRAKDMARALMPNPSAELAAELLGEHGHAEMTDPHIGGAPEITATNVGAQAEITVTDVESLAEVTEPRLEAPVAFADTTTTRRGRAESTVTAATPRAVPAEPTERITWPVAIEPASQTTTGEVLSERLLGERSVTAIIDRRPRPMEAGGDTARIDRRQRRRVTMGMLPIDDSLTAIIRRRTGAPLGEDV